MRYISEQVVRAEGLDLISFGVSSEDNGDGPFCLKEDNGDGPFCLKDNGEDNGDGPFCLTP